MADLTDVVKAGYWSSTSDFPVGNIDSRKFTHLFCAYADLDFTTHEVNFPTSTMNEFSNFTQIVQLRNPAVKTLLSIGGRSSNPSAFAFMASDKSKRKKFIDSSIELARTNDFHGLDLSWLYPSTIEERNHLGSLIHEWRVAVNVESENSGNDRLLLTAQVFYSPEEYPYPISAISHDLDWINVMAYDFHSPSNSPNQTGPHAALHSASTEEDSDLPSGNNGIKAWIKEGIPANKLVLGLPFYGCTWNLVNPKKHHVFAPAHGAPVAHPTGRITYSHIMNFQAHNRVVGTFDSTIVTDYCYHGKTWICYDDKKSIIRKVGYAKEEGLLGYFAWHVGADKNWTLSITAAHEWGV